MALKDYLMTTQLRVLSALHKYEFRHLVQLGVYIDRTPRAVWKAVKTLEKLNLVETELKIPTDADRRYRFTKIKLTRLGRELARLCSQIEEVIDSYEPPDNG